MNYVILVFGIMMILIGAIIIIKPDAVFNVLRSHSESVNLHIIAVVVRITLGVILITYAIESKYPIILQIIGWLLLTAGIILGAIGRSKFKKLMAWALTLAPSYGRVSGMIAILFGGFLGYAVL